MQTITNNSSPLRGSQRHLRKLCVKLILKSCRESFFHSSLTSSVSTSRGIRMPYNTFYALNYGVQRTQSTRNLAHLAASFSQTSPEKTPFFFRIQQTLHRQSGKLQRLSTHPHLLGSLCFSHPIRNTNS